MSGRSLVPLLKNPKQHTGRTVVTTFDKGNYSLTAVRWHYLRYADGSEELYDRESDPNEWTNRAGEGGADAKAVLEEMRSTLGRLPK